MSDYTCPTCNKPCQVEPEDQGIGPYEFWGQKCCDTHNVMVSSCCGADMEEQISYYDWLQDRKACEADRRYDEWRDEQSLKEDH